MKNSGVLGVALGLLGIVFILLFDVIVGKPYHIGSKSITGFVVCVVVMAVGVGIQRKSAKA